MKGKRLPQGIRKKTGRLRERLWEEETINKLGNKSKIIQERLPSTDSQMTKEKLSSKFKQVMQKMVHW